MGRSRSIQIEILSIFSPPHLSRGIFKVWTRNFFYFRYKWVASAFWAVFEPVLYLCAIGLGLGHFVGQIENVSYVEWFFPGLLASTAMMVSFFETTYGSFAKLHHQKLYASLLHTPVSSHDIVGGEILWATTKGMIGACGVGVVGLGIGEISILGILPSLAILFLVSWVFAAIGMLMTSFATHYDSFIYAQSGFIMPMYLFSGTYFPVSKLPKWAQALAWSLPLTHGVSAVRLMLLGGFSNQVLISGAVLLAMALGISNWAILRIEKKLIY